MQARTFTESARRAQIVTAAIEVIAEVGYAKASFSRIAKQAALSSTGMISYHFAGKDDLLTACVASPRSSR
jgi:AcrR family transcriptional regulator